VKSLGLIHLTKNPLKPASRSNYPNKFRSGDTHQSMPIATGKISLTVPKTSHP
jgi:hypothetical protein